MLSAMPSVRPMQFASSGIIEDIVENVEYMRPPWGGRKKRRTVVRPAVCGGFSLFSTSCIKN